VKQSKTLELNELEANKLQIGGKAGWAETFRDPSNRQGGCPQSGD
jgi:hypothetical protein